MEREHLDVRSQDQRRKRLAACGVAINAVFGRFGGGPASVEVTVGARGQKEGARVSNRKKRRRERKKERRRVQQRHGGKEGAGHDTGSSDARSDGRGGHVQAAVRPPPAPSDDAALALKFRSRLSRSALLDAFIALYECEQAGLRERTYREWKDAAVTYQARKRALFATEGFSGWVRGGRTGGTSASS